MTVPIAKDLDVIFFIGDILQEQSVDGIVEKLDGVTEKGVASPSYLPAGYDTGRDVEAAVAVIVKEKEIEIHIAGRRAEIAQGGRSHLYRISPPAKPYQRIDIPAKDGLRPVVLALSVLPVIESHVDIDTPQKFLRRQRGRQAKEQRCETNSPEELHLMYILETLQKYDKFIKKRLCPVILTHDFFDVFIGIVVRFFVSQQDSFRGR